MSRANKDIQEEQDTLVNNSTSPSIHSNSSHDPYQALRFRDFRLLLIGTFITSIGEQMLNVAIGWELYERTGSALILGLVGLIQVIPIIILSLPAGHIVDQFNRKTILLVTLVVLAFSSLGLTMLSYTHGSLILIFSCLLVIGGAVAFSNPASSVLLSLTVPPDAYENAATWTSSSWQLASVLGPALGGLVIALNHGATPVYAINAGAMLLSGALLLLIQAGKQRVRTKEKTTLRSLGEGIHFLRRTQIILAAITLDLFAVLLGGAVTLLPIFAKDILHVGPTGLGWLRAAPSIGAVCAALVLAHLPPFKKAGHVLLWSVAGFGLATIIFGVSHSFLLSLLMLVLLGGLDNVSVVIRSTLLLIRTPEEMRGRVSAVNEIFIASSNQLGGFESGLTAQLFGPIVSVVGGGIGTILVVLFVALLWPQLRQLSSLREREE